MESPISQGNEIRERNEMRERSEMREVKEIGETLPLFETPVAGRTRRSVRRRRTRLSNGPQDRHMRAAWRLSKELKAAKSGHKAGRKLAKLSPGQRHLVGTAICEHLLASLRQQVESDNQQSNP